MTLKEAQHGGIPNSDSKIVNIESKGKKAKAARHSRDEAKRAAKAEKKNAPIEEISGLPAPDSVSLLQSPGTNAEATIQAAQPQEHHMTLTFKSLDKRGRNAIFTGAAVSLRFPIGAFPSKQAPATLEIDGLAEKVEKAAKIVETKEERKARLAALPRLTLAEKVAKAEARTEALRKKLASQPAL